MIKNAAPKLHEWILSLLNSISFWKLHSNRGIGRDPFPEAGVNVLNQQRNGRYVSDVWFVSNSYERNVGYLRHIAGHISKSQF